MRDEGDYTQLDDDQRSYVKAQAIVRCGLCDDDGYRGSTVCDHIDHAATAQRHMPRIREILAKEGRK